MAKKIKVLVEQGVKIGGKYPAIGSEIDIEGNEAKRLIGLGAVSLPRPKLEEVQQASPVSTGKTGGKGGNKGKQDAEIEALIEQIKAASSQEELEELVAGNEKVQAVVDTASARLEELLATE